MFRLPRDLDAHFQAGGTLIVPTPQRARAVQLAYAAAQLAVGRRVWPSPDVCTLSGWARRTCERRAEEVPSEWPRILGATEEWLLWRQVAVEVAGSLPFLDAALLGESLRRASMRAAEWAVPLAAAAPDSEAGLLFQAQRLFESRCRELRAAAVSALTSRLLEAPRVGPLLLRGFDALPRRLAALETPASADAQRPALTTMAPRAVRTVDSQSQLEAIASWCRDHLAAKSDARLLVVLPESAGTAERLAALVQDALDPAGGVRGTSDAREVVAIEGGEPLGSLALPSQALLGLGALAGSELDAVSVSRWVTAPYWSSPAPEQRALLAQLLRERRLANLNLRELLGTLQLAPLPLQGAAREFAVRLRSAAATLGEGSATPRRWAERFEDALAALGWPGTLPPDSAVQQTRLRWRELLEEFGELTQSVGTLSRAGALELLRALAWRTPYRPADPDVPVTISPMLTAPVVIYDGIWVASLSADVLPQPVAPEPFLPPRAQAAAGMPEASAVGRRSQAQALLAAWRAGTADLVLSVPAREADLEVLPSPVLDGLTLEDHRPPSLWLPMRLHRVNCTEALLDVNGTPFNPRRPLPWGTRAVTLQNACPFRAYAELRLGAAPPEPAEPGVPMDQRGVLLHTALQLLWERLHDSRSLTALDGFALDRLIGECVVHAAGTLRAERRRRGGRRRARHASVGQFDLFTELSPALARECRRAQRLIHRLCELERARPPFVVEATEQATQLALGGGRLHMRLDRVDRVAGGRAVLDYKSGRPGTVDWFGERPTHPQLLAYTTALGADVVALATVNLTAREVRFTGVAAAGDLLPKVKALPAASGAPAADWSAQQRSWQAVIERLIRAFVAGEAPVDPAPGACDYCHAVDICRIGAHESPEAATHADETDE